MEVESSSGRVVREKKQRGVRSCISAITAVGEKERDPGELRISPDGQEIWGDRRGEVRIGQADSHRLKLVQSCSPAVWQSIEQIIFVLIHVPNLMFA